MNPEPQIVCNVSPYLKEVIREICEKNQIKMHHNMECIPDSPVILIEDTDIPPSHFPHSQKITISQSGKADFAKPIRVAALMELIAVRYNTEKSRKLITIAGDLIYSHPDRTLGNKSDSFILTDKESELLNYLLSSKEGADKETILQEVWGLSAETDTHTIETHIMRLRKKLEELSSDQTTIVNQNRKYILTIYTHTD